MRQQILDGVDERLLARAVGNERAQRAKANRHLLVHGVVAHAHENGRVRGDHGVGVRHDLDARVFTPRAGVRDRTEQKYDRSRCDRRDGWPVASEPGWFAERCGFS